MKRIVSALLVLAVTSLRTPCASAEIYQDLDPMVSPEAQVIVTSESPVASVAADRASNVVSTENIAKKEKKSEVSKKKKEKKGTKKKSSKKSSKSEEKQSQKKSSSGKKASFAKKVSSATSVQ